MRKNKVITLTTDFGTRDGYVGAMKGRILALCPQATLVDISHDIDPQDVVGAAWCLARSTPVFPEGSIHLAVVDPGVGSERRPLILKSNDQWYVGPDNGLFGEIVRRCGTQEIRRIHPKTEWWQSHDSFDGLALFAPASAQLADGTPLDELGAVTGKPTVLPEIAPRIEEGGLRGRIIMFDRFGNAATNISADYLKAWKSSGKDGSYSAVSRGQTFPLVGHYQAGENRSALAIINSDGLLELSVFRTSARETFGLELGDEVVVKNLLISWINKR
ncbi:MAG: SAM-dependent chlorinase/fluorinase [Proteobacteria bacterium]|nr:SAM-dependent chlorinase/fluorinase [Pseudomonadota bacterium]